MRVDQSLNIMVARVTTGSIATALRGRVPSRWLAWTFVALTAVSVGLAAWEEIDRSRRAPWLEIAAYFCMWFFVSMYALAWRIGSVVRRLLALTASVVLIAFLVWFHLDQAQVRLEYLDATGPVAAGALPTAGNMAIRQMPASTLQMISAGLDLLAGALLLAHGLYLGWGERSRLTTASGAPMPVLPWRTHDLLDLDLPPPPGAAPPKP